MTNPEQPVKDFFIQGRFGSLREHEELLLPTAGIVQQVQEQEVLPTRGVHAARSSFPGTPARSQMPRTSPTSNSNGPSGISTGQHLWYSSTPVGLIARGWTPTVLPQELEADFIRSLDMAGGDRLPLGAAL